MDPEANLREQRHLVARINAQWDNDEETTELGFRLAELVQALDEWLSHGGFAPSAWGRTEP